MIDRFDIEQVIRILGLEIRADQADDGRDFDVACRIALEKLMKCKEYENLEEQGLLLKLPCKVGDVIAIKPGKDLVVVKSSLEALQKRVEFVTYDEAKMAGTFVRLPERNELNADINESLIVEFYNRG